MKKGDACRKRKCIRGAHRWDGSSCGRERSWSAHSASEPTLCCDVRVTRLAIPRKNGSGCRKTTAVTYACAKDILCGNALQHGFARWTVAGKSIISLSIPKRKRATALLDLGADGCLMLRDTAEKLGCEGECIRYQINGIGDHVQTHPDVLASEVELVSTDGTCRRVIGVKALPDL